MITKKPVSLTKVAKITDSIPGFLLRSEGKLLYDLAKSCPTHTKIVEIGSWKGRSTLWLYYGSSSGYNAEIFAIDPHTGSPELISQFGKRSSLAEFKTNLKRVGADKLVKPFVMSSENAAKIITYPVSLLFIDGNHSYQSVKQDFEMWFPKMIINGGIVLHDTIGFPEINEFVRKYIFLSPNIKVIKIVDSIVYGQKVISLTLNNMLKNRYILFIHDTCVYLSKHHPPMVLISFGKYIINKIH